MGHDQLRRCLILVLVLAFASRLTVFGAGGEAGAYAVFVIVPACSLAIVVFSIRQFILRMRHGASVPILKWGLLLLSVLGFYAVGLDWLPGWTRSGAVLVSTVSVIFLVGLAVLDKLEGSHGGRAPNGQGSQT